jgi:hypothetical protein
MISGGSTCFTSRKHLVLRLIASITDDENVFQNSRQTSTKHAA